VAKVVERSPYGGPNDDHRAYDGEGRAFHFDHRIPFSKGGLSDETNIVLACARCNLRKGAGDKPNDRQERKESYVDPRQGKLALKFD
jgi:5-methylcytosine-specific restriction endonuclease McrA